MKLTIFNGSPKPGKNNTEVLIDQFVAGLKSRGELQVEVYKLNKLASVEEAVKIFEQSENILLAFPLYCYAMPGGVKSFIDSLAKYTGKCQGKNLAFLVQFGFNEAIHARPLEQYFIKLSRILGGNYVGTIIKGGCDALNLGYMPGTKKILEGIFGIGATLGETGCFDDNELKKFSQPEYQKKQSVLIMKVILKFINHYYWGAKLRKNGVSVEASFAKPYEANNNF